MKSPTAALLVVAASAVTASLTLAATANAAPNRDRAPECVTVRLAAPSGASAYVKGCGGAGGQESPWQDWLKYPARQPVTMDGVRTISPANCPKVNPCVLMAENAPQS